MANEIDNRRFRIPPEASARVHTHAALAYKTLRSFELYTEGYTQRLVAVTGEHHPQGSASTPEAMQSQLAGLEQFEAARRDLEQVAEDAKQTGTEALRKRKSTPEPRVELMSISPHDSLKLAVTPHVIMDRLKREARDAADQLDRLIEQLDGVADPETLLLAQRLGRLAKGLRPPGAPPGPYAPRRNAA